MAGSVTAFDKTIDNFDVPVASSKFVACFKTKDFSVRLFVFVDFKAVISSVVSGIEIDVVFNIVEEGSKVDYKVFFVQMNVEISFKAALRF
jgi:hypothetical protein